MAAQINVPFLQFHTITKRFPGVLALNEVSFAVERGHCHALIGENGAGKSTLGKILAGVYTADSGELHLDGRVIHPANPLAARHLGIAMVHQELAFCPNLTVAENLCLGDLPGRAGWVNQTEMAARAQFMLQEIEADIDVKAPISELSTGQEQMVQIAAAVGTHAQIIVMDEPTSSLSAHESEHFFHLLQRLKSRGITLLYVSHRMEEIFRLCDTVTVLRDGQHVSTSPVSQTTPDQVVHQMIGRDYTRFDLTHSTLPSDPQVLQVDQLSSPGKFSGVSFQLHRGEILGLAGLVGAGRSEIAQAIFGLDPKATGTVAAHGIPLPLHSVAAALEAGIGLLPEDRKRQGLILSQNCRENAALAILKQLTRAGFVQRRKERQIVQSYVDQLRVRTPSIETSIHALSGGNQQKIALAKWLARQCSILIVDEPTRGVDVGAKSEIHHLLDELAAKGLAILMISSELPELLTLCDRLLVIRQGRSAGELHRSQFSESAVIRLMTGI